METEVAGEENARSNTDDAVATEGEAGADDPAGKRLPKLPPQKLARDPAIALTAPRPQQRQALRRPPIPPPLLQRQAPKSPSPTPI